MNKYSLFEYSSLK